MGVTSAALGLVGVEELGRRSDPGFTSFEQPVGVGEALSSEGGMRFGCELKPREHKLLR